MKVVAVPVPPLPVGSVPVTCAVRLTFESVPPSVRLPLDVTLPVKVMPLTVPVPLTLVTVPTETEPPRLIAEPLIVIDEFVSWLLAIPLSVPPSVKEPLLVTDPVSVMPLTVPVPLTLVTVPTYWSFDVIVKLGYVPVTAVVPAPAKDTT